MLFPSETLSLRETKLSQLGYPWNMVVNIFLIISRHIVETYLIINCRQNIQSIKRFNNLISADSAYRNCSSTHLHHLGIKFIVDVASPLFWNRYEKSPLTKNWPSLIESFFGVVVSSSSTQRQPSLSQSHNLPVFIFETPEKKTEGERQSIEKSNNIGEWTENWLWPRFLCGTLGQLKLMTVDWLSASSEMCAFDVV